MNGGTRARAELSSRIAGPARSVLTDVTSVAPTRLFTPKNHGHAAWVFATHLGGGFVTGDHVTIDLEVADRATLLFGTQAYTKIYPGESSCAITVDVGSGATYLGIAEPIQAYAGATYAQRTLVRLAEGAECLLWEALQEGRSVRGEHWAFERVALRTEIQYAGTPLLVDATELDGARGALAARMRGHTELVTILAVGAGPARALTGLSTLQDPHVLVGLETREGHPPVTLVRAAGDSHEAVAHVLAPFLRNLSETLGDDPFARRW